MISIKVPPLGESIVEATIARWLKKEGDAVAQGETLVELETDKITVEVPAFKAGVLTKRAHAEGDTVKVDDELGTLDETAAGAAAPTPTPAPLLRPAAAQSAAPAAAKPAAPPSKPATADSPQPAVAVRPSAPRPPSAASPSRPGAIPPPSRAPAPKAASRKTTC